MGVLCLLAASTQAQPIIEIDDHLHLDEAAILAPRPGLGALEHLAAQLPSTVGIVFDRALLPIAGHLEPDIRLRLADRLLDRDDPLDLPEIARLLDHTPPPDLAPAWSLAEARYALAGDLPEAAANALLRAFPEATHRPDEPPPGWCDLAAPVDDTRLTPWVSAACEDRAPPSIDPVLTAPVQLWLGTARYRRGDDGHAREVLSELADWEAAPLPDRCAAAAQLGRAEERTGSDERALVRYAWVLDHCEAGSDPHHRARFGSGRVCVRDRDRTCAELHLRELPREYPEATTVDDALFHLADLYQRLGDEEAWAAAVEESLALAADGDMWRETVWRRARHLWTEGAPAEASALLSRALARFGWDPTSYSQGRFEYMVGLLTTEQGRPEDAAASFTSGVATYPLTFYGSLCCDALRNVGRECAWPEREGPIAPSTWPLGACVPPEGRWLALTEAGHFEAAANALAALPADCPEGLWIQALLLDLDGNHNRAHEIPRRRLGDWASRVGPELDRRFSVAYPRPHLERVRAESERTGVDSSLLYAVMREESGFRDRVHSYAGAQGLMQLMPRTAEGHTEDVDGDLTPERLLEPDINIRIGANFLAHLGNRLGGNPLLMVAAYNAGRGAVSRWLGDRPLEDPGLWIEAVGPTQTRDYTKRVLTSVEVYDYLYR